MKYSFGVPAWLGAIKVSFLVFGIPALVAVLVASVVGHRMGLSHFAEAVVFAATFLLAVVALLVILAAWSRRTAKKKTGQEGVV